MAQFWCLEWDCSLDTWHLCRTSPWGRERESARTSPHTINPEARITLHLCSALTSQIFPCTSTTQQLVFVSTFSPSCIAPPPPSPYHGSCHGRAKDTEVTGHLQRTLVMQVDRTRAQYSRGKVWKSWTGRGKPKSKWELLSPNSSPNFRAAPSGVPVARVDQIPQGFSLPISL